MKDYLESLERLGRARVTREAAQRWLTLFLEELEGGLAELTPEHLAAFQQRLLWQPGPAGSFYAPNSVDQALRTVRTYLRWAHAQGQLASDPTRHWVLGRPRQRPQPVLSREELARLLDTPPATPAGLRNRAVLGVFTELGLGPTAVRQLELDQAEPVGRRLANRELSPALAEHLARYLESGRPALSSGTSSALFLNRLGQVLSIASLLQLVTKAALSAGLTLPVGPRQLHRSFREHRQAFYQRRFSF